MWLTFNLVDCTGRLMSLLKFLKKPSDGESSPLLPTSQSSAEKTANDEAATKKERKKEVLTSYITINHLYFVMSWLNY